MATDRNSSGEDAKPQSVSRLVWITRTLGSWTLTSLAITILYWIGINARRLGWNDEMNPLQKNPLHLSTWLILGGVALALLMIVVPGETDNRYYARDIQLQEHGWPWIHLYRFVPKPNSVGEGREQLQQRLQSYRDSLWSWFFRRTPSTKTQFILATHP